MKHLEYQFTIGDKSWTLDIGPLTVDDYIELRNRTGFGVTRLLVAFDDMDPVVLKAMVWMARRKSGEDIAIDDPEMSFTMQDLRLKKVRDDTENAAQGKQAGEEPGPTRAPRAPRAQTSRKTSKSK